MTAYPSRTKIYDDAEAWATKAAAIIAADRKHTPAEQAALDTVNADRWVLWHTDHTLDYALAVIRLLSRAGMLRDIAHEQQQAAADRSWGAYSDNTRAADRTALARLDALATEAADRLDAGNDPAEVAAWLHETRDAISNARDQATTASTSAA